MVGKSERDIGSLSFGERRGWVRGGGGLKGMTQWTKSGDPRQKIGALD